MTLWMVCFTICQWSDTLGSHSLIQRILWGFQSLPFSKRWCSANGGHFLEMLWTNIWILRFAGFLCTVIALWLCLVSCDLRMLDITCWSMTCSLLFCGPCKVHIAENLWSLSINREARSLGGGNSFFLLKFHSQNAGLGIPFWLVFFNFSLVQPPSTATFVGKRDSQRLPKRPGRCQPRNLPRDIPKWQLTDKIANATRKWVIPRNYTGPED